MKNFHLPLPEQIYSRLRAEAERSQVPATALAREAIDLWLRHQLRKSRHDAIAAYAEEIEPLCLCGDSRPQLSSGAKRHRPLQSFNQLCPVHFPRGFAG